MHIAVLVLGIIGFIMSFVLVGIVPATIAVILGLVLMLSKKRRLHKLPKVEVIVGMVFAILAILIGVFVYISSTKGLDIYSKWYREVVDFSIGIKDKVLSYF